MTFDHTALEWTEYSVVAVCPRSRKVFVLDTGDAHGLPSVRVPQSKRPAEQVSRSLKAIFGLQVLVLDFLGSLNEDEHIALAELLIPYEGSFLKAVSPEKIFNRLPPKFQQTALTFCLKEKDNKESAVTQIGWLDEAIHWVETITDRKLVSKSRLVQYNAGAGFSLLRFSMDDGREYWLKATGEPNRHELPVTKLLSELNPNCLPQFIGYRAEWNAWLTAGGSNPFCQFSDDPLDAFMFLEAAVGSIAEIQVTMNGRVTELLAAGAFDQRLEVLHDRSDELFAYLEEAMSLQSSTRVPRVEQVRLLEMCSIFKDVCRRTGDLGLPDSILHGDLNCGNILFGSGNVQFIDWCEVYVGNPLVTLQHLLLLNTVKESPVRGFINRLLIDTYRKVWMSTIAPSGLANALRYMPIMAIASTLYGRGNWLTSAERTAPNRMGYARALARHMDRAIREQASQEDYAKN